MQTELAILTEDDIINAIPDAIAEPDTTYQTSPPPTPDVPAVSEAQKRTKRTVFTRRQLVQLEQRFLRQTFLSKEERADLAEELQLTERQIMVWFQNRRGRLKRRGPADSAYTADKLNEVNHRRPYPFLYGLLSSMQYRYPQPYQNTTTTTSTTATTTAGSCFAARPGWSGSGGAGGNSNGALGSTYRQSQPQPYAHPNFGAITSYPFPSYTLAPGQFQRQFAAQYGGLPSELQPRPPPASMEGQGRLTSPPNTGMPVTSQQIYNTGQNSRTHVHSGNSNLNSLVGAGKRKLHSPSDQIACDLTVTGRVGKQRRLSDGDELNGNVINNAISNDESVRFQDIHPGNVQRPREVISPPIMPDLSKSGHRLTIKREREGTNEGDVYLPPNVSAAYRSSGSPLQLHPEGRCDVSSPESAEETPRNDDCEAEKNNNFSKHVTPCLGERKLAPCAGSKTFVINWEQPDDRHAISVDWMNYHHLEATRDGGLAWPVLEIPDITSEPSFSHATMIPDNHMLGMRHWQERYKSAFDNQIKSNQTPFSSTRCEISSS